MSQELQPQEDHAGAPELPLALTPRDATRSRHWRFWLGLFHLITGLLTGFVTMVNTVMVNEQMQEMQSAGQRPPGAWLAGMIAIVVGFSVVSVAGVVIGIWNLKTLKGTSRPPLIAAIVVSSTSIVLMMIFIGGPWDDPVKVGWFLLHALVAVWTIGILRLKKVPTPLAAA